MVNNGMFDDFISKTKEMADKAGAKVTEVIDLSKLKVEMANIKNAINADYQDLGELVYESVDIENLSETDKSISERVNMIAERIKAKKTHLDEIQAQYETVKKVKICSVCSAKNTNEAQYCTNCGSEI